MSLLFCVAKFDLWGFVWGVAMFGGWGGLRCAWCVVFFGVGMFGVGYLWGYFWGEKPPLLGGGSPHVHPIVCLSVSKEQWP